MRLKALKHIYAGRDRYLPGVEFESSDKEQTDYLIATNSAVLVPEPEPEPEPDSVFKKVGSRRK